MFSLSFLIFIYVQGGWCVCGVSSVVKNYNNICFTDCVECVHVFLVFYEVKNKLVTILIITRISTNFNHVLYQSPSSSKKTSQRLVVNSVYSAITTKPPQVIIKQATILFLTTVFPPLLCSNAIPYPLNCLACTAVISFICDKKPQSYWNKCNVISNQISYFQTCIKTNLVPSLHDNISMWLSFFFTKAFKPVIWLDNASVIGNFKGLRE